MTDKKLTDSEIVKALECCTMNGLCEFCYLKSDKKDCQDRLHKDAFDLINRLQAENEELVGNIDRLKAELFDKTEQLNVELQAMRGAANSYKAENKRLSTLATLGKQRANDYRVMRDRALKAEAEIERLKEENKNLAIVDYFQWEKDLKAEAYKEFAEASDAIIDIYLAKYSIKDFAEFKAICQILRGVKNEISNLLKELVGE